MRSIVLLSVISLSLIMLTCGGCEKLTIEKVDLETSVETLKTEAMKMDVAQLREMAMLYRDKITANNEKIIGMMQGMKDDKNAIGEDLNELMVSAKALQERYKLYYDRLVELKADVSGLSLTE